MLEKKNYWKQIHQKLFILFVICFPFFLVHQETPQAKIDNEESFENGWTWDANMLKSWQLWIQFILILPIFIETGETYMKGQKKNHCLSWCNNFLLLTKMLIYLKLVALCFKPPWYFYTDFLCFYWLLLNIKSVQKIQQLKHTE